MSKVKVHALAKKFGFSSKEFVGILKDVGYPVKSYQASLEEWDVPIIEERLRKAGLIADEGAGASDQEAGGGGGGGFWDQLKAKATAPTKPSDESESDDGGEGPATATKEPDEGGAAPTTQVTEATTEPTAPPDGPVAEPANPDVETPEPPAEPAPATPEAEAPPSAPTPTSAPTSEAGGGDETSTSATSCTAPPAGHPGVPKPKPKASAKRVGRIDLEALGVIKSQQAQRRKGSTFTDVRERESARRREMRQKKREIERKRKRGEIGPKEVSTVERKREVVLEPPFTVKGFSTATGIPAAKVMQQLLELGNAANINSQLDAESVELLSEEFGVKVRIKEEVDLERELMEEIQASRKEVDDSMLAPRPPVVAFLGHVDHGKTSLIDAIRETRVAAKEAGGITQSIGAYVADLGDGRSVTVIDTPGHQAFTAMRARGARVTDVAVLVVAADDGVKPQTEEAASHAKEAGVPIVVALNKIDSPAANPEQVKSQLSGIGLQPEDWGGNVGVIPVSALRKQGIDELLERILIEAELLDLKAHPKGDALGTVLEAAVEKGKGKVATVLVQDGTLRPREVVLAGTTYGKVRLMFDHTGKPAKEAPPSTPVQILGLEDLPPIGERFYVVKDLKLAKEVAEKRKEHQVEIERAEKAAQVDAHNLFEKLDESLAERVRYVVKADVVGTVEVLRESLKGLSSDEVIVDVVHSGVGVVTESDVQLAEASQAVVLAFNVAPEGKARKEAERVGVEIRRYDVIYDLLEEVQRDIEGRLAPEVEEHVIGHAEVLEIFRSARWGVIAGCRVEDGVIKRSAKARILREGQPIHEAPIESLRRFKDDVREVTAPDECGLKVEGFEDYQVGDVVEAVEIVEVERKLEEVLEEAQEGAGENR